MQTGIRFQNRKYPFSMLYLKVNQNATFRIVSLSTKKSYYEIVSAFIIHNCSIFNTWLFIQKKNDQPTSILRRWNVKIDSFYVGVGASNHEVVYVGQPVDYFNFTPDGHIYMMENSIFDTLMYTVSSDSVFVQNFGTGEGKGRLQFPSIKNWSISSGYSFTPGGAFGRTVYLKR
ncbi:MAG: hypothetical protein ABI683_03110 [Ginsengibacter sp.]